MKTLFIIVACFAEASATYATTDILDIKIDWLNAKECGFDGCKPQRVIMRQGTMMNFSWGPGAELEKRGVFALFPSIQGDTLKLKISRTRGETLIAEAERVFQMGSAQEMHLKEVTLRITITEFQEANAKK